jgi:hypothetical protein
LNFWNLEQNVPKETRNSKMINYSLMLLNISMACLAKSDFEGLCGQLNSNWQTSMNSMTEGSQIQSGICVEMMSIQNHPDTNAQANLKILSVSELNKNGK